MNQLPYNRTEELEHKKLTPDGNTGANLYRLITPLADEPVQVPHGLSRKPVQVEMVARNKSVSHYETEKTADHVLIVFSAAEADVTMRFS